jgi:hypothetical protein
MAMPSIAEANPLENSSMAHFAMLVKSVAIA